MPYIKISQNLESTMSILQKTNLFQIKVQHCRVDYCDSDLQIYLYNTLLLEKVSFLNPFITIFAKNTITIHIVTAFLHESKTTNSFLHKRISLKNSECIMG